VSTAEAVSTNPFRVPDFRLYWGCRIAAVFATQTQSTTLAWQVYRVVRDRTLAHGDSLGAAMKAAAFSVGMIGLVQFLPIVLMSLPAGEIADRHDRRLILMACLSVDAVCAALFVALSLSHQTSLPLLLAVAALYAAARAFIAPASSSLLPNLVPRTTLPRAIAINSMAFQVGTIAGPAMAGPLIAISPTFAYCVATALFVIGALALLPMKPHKPLTPPSGLSRWAAIREGLSYVWRTRIVFGAISLDLVAVLLGGATLLMPAFATDVLHVGAHGYGVLRSATGVGAFGMAFYLSRFSIRRHAGLWMFAAVAVFGIATIVFGVSTLFWLTVLALIVIGAADMISVNVRQTLIQLTTPDAMRGRVSAVSMIFISASNELGEFETGVVARFLGVVGAAIFGGVGSVAVTGLWAWWFPGLRKADRLT
jgi:MFS family permease